MVLSRLFLGNVPPQGRVTVPAIGVAASTALGKPIAFPAGWDTTRLYSGFVTFSNGDKTATVAPDDVSNRQLWSAVEHDNGKFFAEVTFNSGVGAGVGLMSPGVNGPYLDASGTVYVYGLDGTTSYPGVFAPLVQGDVVGVAANIDAGKVWFRVNGGPWNNDPTQGPGAMTIPRPYGLDYLVPGYDTPYNYLTDVPVPHMKWSTGNAGGPFTNSAAGVTAAFDAARAANLPLYIDVVADYSGSHASNKLPSGLYGRPGVRFIFTGTLTANTPCFAYQKDRSTIIKGIEFVSFGTVFGMSTRTQSINRGYTKPWEIHGSRNASYATQRCVDTGTICDDSPLVMGVGVPLDYTVYPEALTTIGPDIWISDCKFTDCENAYLAWADMIGVGRIDFHRNILVGTWGGVSGEGSWYTQCHAVNNDWSGCDKSNHAFMDPPTNSIPDPLYVPGGRMVPSAAKSNRFSTLINMGTNTGVDVDNFTDHVIQIFNNDARDIIAECISDGTNAGVLADIRAATPAVITGTSGFDYACSVEISFNKVVGVLGRYGQEDSNAFYTKARGVLIEGNHVRHCGSDWNDVHPTRDGPESSGAELKDTTNMAGAAANAMVVLRGNEWVDQPVKQNPVVGAVIGTNNVGIPVVIIGDTFRNCHIANTGGSVPTLIRHFSAARFFSVMCCNFYNCNTPSPSGLIGVHSPAAMTYTLNEVSNNKAFSGPDVTYSGDTQLIKASATLSGSKVGLNTLHDSGGTPVGNMTSSFGTPTGLVPRSYTRPTVTIPG